MVLLARIAPLVRVSTLLFAMALNAPTSSSNPAAVAVTAYVKRTWQTLTRSHQNLAAAAVDPKSHPLPDGRWPVYVAPNEDIGRLKSRLRAEMSPADFDRIFLKPLPQEPGAIRVHGLLYLPRPYVVPGGRFNEMYGWDSFFIEMGLLHDGEVALARDMTENVLYEIRHYGKILNANRTYYLTRSQPPFLTEMLLAIYRNTGDRAYLSNSLDAIEKCYRFWTTEPHLTPETGLSRYFDTGEGPAPEVVASEVDKKGRPDYELIRQYYRSHKIRDYDVRRFYDAAKDQLTPLFYENDRSMRESGFDPSSRFGQFGAETINYDPVCLNSLLYLMETQSAEIMDILKQKQRAEEWRRRAEDRARLVNQLMWDPKEGLYFDYDFLNRRVRRYPFLTTFYPLWVGLASEEQAARVMSRLALFERSGGLQTSTHRSGDQWDAPFGWAPLEWIAVQGMRRYGYAAEADRVSKRFTTLVEDLFQKHGTILEKYDVVNRNRDPAGELRFGYTTDEAGFGWTNAVYTALLDGERM